MQALRPRRRARCVACDAVRAGRECCGGQRGLRHALPRARRAKRADEGR